MSPKKICLAFLFFLPLSLSAQTQLIVGIASGLWHEHSTTYRCQINLPAPCEINIQVTGWESTLNWVTDYDRIYIYNSEFEPIGYEGEYTTEDDPYLFHMIGDDANLVARVGQEGTYYIDFHSGNNYTWPPGKTMQEYSVLVTITQVNDFNEPNDNINSPTLIYPDWTVTAAQWRRTNTNAVWYDDDWYLFNLPSPGRITINLTGWEAVFNWMTDFDRLYLYDGQGYNIGSSEADPYYSWMMEGTPAKVITINYGAPGNYYLEFHSGNAYKTTTYTLETIFTPVDDQFEPNDEMWNAYPVELNNDYQAYQWNSSNPNTDVTGDEDYYKVSLPSAGQFKITLEGWHYYLSWGADYDRMYVYDSQGNALGGSGADPYFQVMMANTRRDYTLNVTQAGNYIVRLHSGDAYSVNPYIIRFEFTSVTATDDNLPDELPKDFGLSQNYPNPFNPTTTIEYQIPVQNGSGDVFVSLKIFDLLGNEIATLVDESKRAGYYATDFDASTISSGVYIYRLTAGNYSASHKMVLLK